MITTSEIVRGCQSGAVIDPATIFRQALKASATSILLFQTRANGNVVPSAEDWELTRSLIYTRAVLGIAVYDHLIVASGERWVSLNRLHRW